jgi:hypothetical protein
MINAVENFFLSKLDSVEQWTASVFSNMGHASVIIGPVAVINPIS